MTDNEREQYFIRMEKQTNDSNLKEAISDLLAFGRNYKWTSTADAIKFSNLMKRLHATAYRIIS